MNDTELRDIENPTWDLLVEVMALGERIGLDSTKLADYHTQLLSLIANHSASVENSLIKLSQGKCDCNSTEHAPQLVRSVTGVVTICCPFSKVTLSELTNQEVQDSGKD